MSFTKSISNNTLGFIKKMKDIFPPYTYTKTTRRNLPISLSTQSYEYTVLQWKEINDDLPLVVYDEIISKITRMHNIGILHGDLHGDNIVFNSYDNDVRIIDLDGAVYIKDVKESDIEKYNDFWDTKNWIEKRLESLDDLLWYEKCIMWNN